MQEAFEEDGFEGEFWSKTRPDALGPGLPVARESREVEGLRLICNLEPAGLPIDREDMDPNCVDNRGQTLVHCAGRLGQEDMLMRLLGGDDAELNRMNNEGRSPLARTLQDGYVGIVKTMLPVGCPGVGLILGDGDGRPLLSLAAEADYQYVLRMNGENVDLNSVEGDRQIPLSWAAAGWWGMGR
ncbi:hypothetical protein B9Z19DRAFT_1191571 [Tuber borchii]|uniref:Uncharacterized protein n=1 Tax=Tuber borchii TaxID=42251 RepID=A0A2T6ZZB1_TUBBO|nr:hypothetical protein B9Z19DRAFT_1191571 [Tuber borchii]